MNIDFTASLIWDRDIIGEIAVSPILLLKKKK